MSRHGGLVGADTQENAVRPHLDREQAQRHSGRHDADAMINAVEGW